MINEKHYGLMVLNGEASSFAIRAAKAQSLACRKTHLNFQAIDPSFLKVALHATTQPTAFTANALALLLNLLHVRAKLRPQIGDCGCLNHHTEELHAFLSQPQP